MTEPLIIGVVSQKGGVGKSTFARMIARELAVNEYDVKIADLDIQQGTSHSWQARRQLNGIEPEIAVERYSTVVKALSKSNQYDALILDGAPHATKATLEIAQRADLIVIPTGLALDDLEPTVLLAQELKVKGIDPDIIVIALSKVGDSQAEIEEARSYLAKTPFSVLVGEIPEKTGYRRASDEGRALTETKFASLNQRADTIIQSLFDRIQREEIETEEQRLAHG